MKNTGNPVSSGNDDEKKLKKRKKRFEESVYQKILEILHHIFQFLSLDQFENPQNSQKSGKSYQNSSVAALEE